MSDPESLDDIYGPGAAEALADAIIIEGEKPVITESQWVVDGDAINWPPEPGIWIAMSGIYETMGEQMCLFKDDKVYYGEGFCTADNALTSLENLGKLHAGGDGPRFIEWCIEWGANSFNMLVPEDMVDPWLAIGFEIVDTKGTNKVLSGSTSEGSKLHEWTMWNRSGFDPALKPSWMD